MTTTPHPRPRPRRSTRWSGTRGASLIETLVALGLFAVTAATMSRFLVNQIRSSSTNHLQTVAYALAAESLEAAQKSVKLDDLRAKLVGTSRVRRMLFSSYAAGPGIAAVHAAATAGRK